MNKIERMCYCLLFLIVGIYVGIMINPSSESKPVMKIEPEIETVKILDYDSNLIKDIKKREGFRGYAYNSSGKITIGYGINIDKSSGNPMDTTEAEMLLINRLKQAEMLLIKEFTEEYFYSFDDNRKYVLYQMMFILGSTRFSKFESFIHFVKKGDFNRASKELYNSKLRTQIKDVKRFCEILKTGQYQEMK